MPASFLTFGDCGDCIYLCPSMKLVAQERGPVILYGRDGLREHDPFTARLHLIKDLLESQDYIEAVLPWNGEPVDYDAVHFRRWGHPFGVTLATLQANWIQLSPNLAEPWLSVERSPHTAGRIVVARSSRYQNHFFPWKRLVEKFRPCVLFIGLKSEYDDFCREFGYVNYWPTDNLKEVAEAIAGCEIFIGNQSAPNAICEGLKHRLLQETCLWTPDCIYPRENAWHCYDGGLEIEILGHNFSNEPYRAVSRATKTETPPNGWRIRLHGHHVRSYSFDIVLQSIKLRLTQEGKPIPDNLCDTIIEQSSEDMPPPEPMGPIIQLQRLLGR